MTPRSEEKESEIQECVVRYARSKGVLAFKWAISGMYGTRGVPDYIFLMNQKILFAEFKSTKGKLTARQEKCHSELKDHGFIVVVINNKNTGKQIIDEYFF